MAQESEDLGSDRIVAFCSEGHNIRYETDVEAEPLTLVCSSCETTWKSDTPMSWSISSATCPECNTEDHILLTA